MLFAGNQQLRDQYQALVKAAEQALVLTVEKIERTLIRMDSGGDSAEEINWLLGRSYRELKHAAIELLTYSWAYDARGGTIEIEIKEDVLHEA